MAKFTHTCSSCKSKGNSSATGDIKSKCSKCDRVTIWKYKQPRKGTKPGDKLYDYNNLAGCVSQHKAKATGTVVGVYHAKQSGMEVGEDDCPWLTVCEDHGVLVSHPTLKLAKHHAPCPDEWCHKCQEAKNNIILTLMPKNIRPVQAIKFDGKNFRAICDFTKSYAREEMGKLWVQCLHGDIQANPGDWIIDLDNGDFEVLSEESLFEEYRLEKIEAQQVQKG